MSDWRAMADKHTALLPNPIRDEAHAMRFTHADLTNAADRRRLAAELRLLTDLSARMIFANQRPRILFSDGLTFVTDAEWIADRLRRLRDRLKVAA